jgi:hypothetical protein
LGDPAVAAPQSSAVTAGEEAPTFSLKGNGAEQGMASRPALPGWARQDFKLAGRFFEVSVHSNSRYLRNKGNQQSSQPSILAISKLARPNRSC